ncbi:hypothetical protein C9446_10970 [Providencia heimbachae]|uniref:gp53-like domain-containing protein n=1 Tax=Providencia heimbachae TaxID=333962 RepID=UPI0010BF1284|nr:hypothetical protein [Providencia heimbachae]QCJ70332.1 hypothetical protein C9446_10970 [Providencia heimbachae]
MAKNEFLPFGTAEGANVLSNQEYERLAARFNGFISGVAKSKELNTVWRQSSVMSSAIAQFIVDSDNKDLLDNGDVAGIKNRLVVAIKQAISGVGYVTTAAMNLELNKKVDKANISGVKGNDNDKVPSLGLFTTEMGKVQPKGNYLSVGDFGVGGTPTYMPVDKLLANEFSRGDKNHTSGAFGYWYGITLAWSGAEKTNEKCQILTGINNRDLYYRFAINATNAPLEFGVAMKIYSSGNTTTDENGFIRASGEATALTTNDVTQTVGSSKTAVMSQFAVNEALGNKQNKGNYLDKDSTSEQLLKAPLYANGEIGAGNPRGTDAVLLLKTIGISEPQFASKHTNNSTWLTHTLPLSKGRLSLENTASKDTAGYLICGDTGIIIQWGEVKASLTETDYRQFPVPFRQRCFQIISGYAGFQDFGGGTAAYANSNKDFIVTSRTKDNVLKDGTVRYIAIGY